jgi:hypothetical protein
MARIKESVGVKAKNDPFDVTVIQKLLAAAAGKLGKPTIDPKRTDGRVDTATHDAIKIFELEVMKSKKTDGKIRPWDKTWNSLVKAAGEVDTNPTGYPEKPENVSHLGDNGRDGIFGTFVITDPKKPHYPGFADNAGAGSNKDDIKILGGWEGRNIQTVEIPQFKTLGFKHHRTRFHRLAVPQLIGLWDAWEKDGLLDRVVSFDGGFNARYKRNTLHGFTRNLSNHSWGTAFDINYSTNRLGATPAILWEDGCVFELVPLAVKWGFYWGGWFGGGRSDGMHFEVRQLTSQPLP